jgi:hypothetical protein
MNRMQKIYRIVCLAFVLAMVACDSDLAEKMGKVNCSLVSENNTAYNGALTFNRGYVHLSQVDVTGNKNGQGEVATTSFPIPEQFFFIGTDPRQPIKVPIPEATYSNPEVQLIFYSDTYTLQLRDTVYNSSPEDNNGDEGHGGDENDEGDDNNESGDDDQNDEGDDDDNEGEDDKDEGEGEDDNEDGDDHGSNDDGEDSDDDDGEDDDDDGRIAATKGKTVNLNDFINNARPSVILLGDYQKSGKSIKIVVALDYNSLVLRPQTDLDSLVVQSSSDMFATATFHPGVWFNRIPAESLEKAMLISFRGETVLFIHKDFNQALHDLITSGIAESTKLVFEIRRSL